MNITSSQLMESFKVLLTTEFADGHGVRPVVAASPGHAIDLLSSGQQGSLALVAYYDSDAPDSDVAWDPRTRATVKAIIYQRQNLAADGQGFGTLTLTDELRKAVTGYMLEGALEGLRYQGMAPVATVEGRLLNGYTLSFGVLYAQVID